MMHEDDDKLRAWVVDQLAAKRPKDDVIQAVVKRTRLYWSEAEKLVDEIIRAEAGTIHKKQSPFLVGIALVTFIGGAVLVLGTSVAAYKIITFYRETQPEMMSMINIMLLVLNETPTALWLGATGLAMMMGSIIGLREVWEAWLKNSENQ